MSHKRFLMKNNEKSDTTSHANTQQKQIKYIS